MLREIDNLSLLNHVLVVSLHETVRDELYNPYLIMEMYESGLDSFLKPFKDKEKNL
jgi:hypothetical protein